MPQLQLCRTPLQAVQGQDIWSCTSNNVQIQTSAVVLPYNGGDTSSCGWQDAVEHARLPAKLTLSWRQGYTAPKSRSAGLPPQLAPALLAHLTAAHPESPLVASRRPQGALPPLQVPIHTVAGKDWSN